MAINHQDISSEWRLYMYLMKCAIRAQKPKQSDLQGYEYIESEELRKRAKANEQSMLMDKVIYEYSLLSNEDNKKIENSMLNVIAGYEKYKMIRHILQVAEANGVQFVFFKGCVLADLYPEYILRYSKDTDIFVSENQFEQAISLMVKEGFVVNERHTKSGVCVLVHKRCGYVLEIHTCLWENYEGKKLDILESFGIDNNDTFINQKACGINVTTLGYEEHLIYQLFHIIKHFSLEGIGVKYLADITLYIDAYGDKIDFKHFWDRMEKIGYAKFSHHLFAICIEYLDMKPDILEGRRMQMGEETLEFMMDLFCNGDIEGRNYESWQILGTMTPYFTGEKNTSKNKLTRKLSIIFPRSKDLQDHYMYAKKHPVLLPIAWVHRITSYLINYRSKADEWYSAGEKLDAAEYRIDLMDKMGLL